MRRTTAIILAGLLASAGAAADNVPVPRCWRADQIGQDIDDGVFRVFIPTLGHDALAVARVLGILYDSMASQLAVGTSPTLDQIEIDVKGDLSHWQPTGTFPTLDSFKTYIVDSLSPVLSEPGVTITCSVVGHPQPAPISH